MFPQHTTKRCGHCGETKPISEFNKNRARPDGVQDQCRACQRVSGRAYWERYPEKARAHYEANREAIVRRATAWNRENGERRGEIRRAWDKRNATYKQAYRDAHKDEARAYYRIWRQANRHIRREHDQRRKARIRSTRIEKVDYAAILERDGYVCHICGGAVSPEHLQFDHVIPLARGGPHTFDNIRVSHADCNNRKKAKLPRKEQV